MKLSRPIFIPLLSLIIVAISMENVLAFCVHSKSGEMGEGLNLYPGGLLALMSFITGTIFYKKFVQPGAQENPVPPPAATEWDEKVVNSNEAFNLDHMYSESQADQLFPQEHEYCEWEPQQAHLRHLKIGQNFASWAQLTQFRNN
ncbi:hypothetical protein LQ236_001752 [Nitrospina gracilis]|nr:MULTISPECIES: hypothetical protein [Nitrospina]MCF8723732.1 hypothetical protein [Nitrospina sp. Nb-3]